MNVLGLDLSLTATGVARWDGAPFTITSALTGVERLDAIRTALLAVCQYETGDGWAWIDLVAIEGYSMGSPGRGRRDHLLGELGGVVRHALWENGVRFVEVPPASVKKYATGKGNASKDEVLTCAVRRLGYGGHSKDEADALWLRAMTLDHYGHPVTTMPAAHRDALVKVAWPELGEAAA